MKYKYDSKTLTFKQVKTYNWMYFLLGIIVFSCISAGITREVIYEKIPVIYREKQDVFSPDNLKQEIVKMGFKFPEIIYKQAILETNNFKSPVFIQGNNCFGMKKAYSRIRCQEGDYIGFASYGSWKQSVTDMGLFQAFYCREIQTEDEYYDFLDKIYCQDITKGKTYSEILKQIK